jgi:nucleosome binding factor SPN SPT16 subunit
MQTYLLGYEFPSTILMFSQADGKRKITVITSQSKSLSILSFSHRGKADDAPVTS